jgi:PAS domain S-box-containing protein
MFGWVAQEMVGRRLEDLGWLAEEDAAELVEQLTGSMADRTDRRSFEMVRTAHKDGSVLACEWYGSVLRNGPGRPISLNVQVLDVTERHRSEETQRLLIGELNHRVKNTLASVQAIATQTLRHTHSPVDFSKTFSGRIQSLARAHGMLSETTWQGAKLHELILDQLRLGTIEEARISTDGPEVNLAPASALRLALIFHELSTNANKYGALANSTGRIALKWSVEGTKLRIRWEEVGGSGIKAPTRRGFGTTLIEQSIRADGGNATASYRSDGVTWEIELLLASAELHDTPRRLAANAPVAASQQNRATAIVGRRILVVEDEPLVALDLVSTLEDFGATVVGPFGTVDEAVAAIEVSIADVAFLDGNLHGEPVDAVAAALTRCGIPFAFVSGYGRESLPKSFAQVEIVTKPFSPEQILEIAMRLCAPSAEVHPIRASPLIRA